MAEVTGKGSDMKELRKVLKRMYIRWQWNQLLAISQEIDMLNFERMELQWGSHKERRIAREVSGLRSDRLCVARSIGLSEAAAELRLPTRTNGRRTPAPEWLLERV